MIENKLLEKEWPSVSVVVVNFNAWKWVEKLFESVLKSDYPEQKLEIIFVDNGSIDGSVGFVKARFGNDSKLNVLSLARNVGWAKAVNLGLRTAKNEILIHISSDIEVSPNWIRELVKVLISDPKIGVVQCNSISLRDKKSIDSGMNFLDKFGFSYGYTPKKEPKEVFFAEALAFGIKRNVLEEVGLFHEFYYMEYDDQDICWRTWLAGYKVFFAPNAVIYHVRGGSVGATFFESFHTRNLYSRNQLITLMQNYELENLFWVLPIVITVDAAKILYLIIRHKSEIALATLKGFLSTTKIIKLIMSERRRIQKNVRKIPDKEVMDQMVPFNPRLLISFLRSQAQGNRFVLEGNPPTYKEIRKSH